MRCLSIKQPWASLIVWGPKRIENRTWNTAYRGPILIHAGMRVDDYALERFASVMPPQMPTGGYLGRAELVDVVTESDDKWFFGPFGFVLDRVEPVPFMPGKGRLGLYAVPETLPM